MIDEKRLLQTFKNLVSIDCESFQERAIADRVHEMLRHLGCQVREDDTAVKIGGSCGNVHAVAWGTEEKPPLLFSAHLDTVAPGRQKKAILDSENILRSDGSSILGADDVAGLAAILEALAVLREKKIAHRPIEVLLSVAEEAHLQGIRHFDARDVKAAEGYVIDTSGPPGRAIKQAPGHFKLTFTVSGQSAHAGIEPEKGVSAVTIAAEAIAAMKLGRVSESVTANIGRIAGGGETNVVAEECQVTAECRAYDMPALSRQKEHMIQCFVQAAKRHGGSVEYTEKLSYQPYALDMKSTVVSRFESVCGQLGIQTEFIASGGGSDNNYLQKFGVNGMVIACGMEKVHSTDEYIRLDDLVTTAKIVLSLILASR